ncbi:transposase, partial [Chromobacterium violaceum]|uniref:transposase n=1 Tax=Chromobacterium violaceum TaxID=536 RepID=UPI001C387B2E
GALLLGGKFEIGEGHLLSHGSVLSQAGVEVVYGKVGDLFRPSLMQFAKRLSDYWRGIVSRVRWPMHTWQREGINNRIKVMKQMAYGYRDSEYFFLKIKAAFPGNP